MGFKEVILKIRPPPHSWVMELFKYYPVRVEILDCKPVSKDKVNEIFELSCDPKYLKEVENRLRKSKYVEYLEILNTNPQDGKMYGVVRTTHCAVCRLFSTSSECFLGSAVYDVDEKYVKWTLIIHAAFLRELINKLRSNGIEVHVESISNLELDKSSTPTFKQEQIIKLAWKLGFFDFPRRITLQELSRTLNLSPATVAEALRSGLKKIISLYFKERSEGRKPRKLRSREHRSNL